MNVFVRTFFRSSLAVLGGLLCVLVFQAQVALAAPQINNQINYQARLMDASGFPVANGNYSIIFSLYDASTSGNRIWTAAGTLGAPTALTVNVQNGLFTVLLGDTGQNTLDTVNWNSDQIYLGVTINADAEMSPRKRFASAPQAFNARQLQGMYASSTASGGQTLFTVNQTEANSATGTRSALDVRTNGTSNASDFLIRGLDGTGATVFSVNRQGNATTSFLNASSIFATMVTSTNLQVNIASFATATVAGQGICLSNGSFCSTGSVAEADTLQTVTNRGSFTTTTLSLFGGLTTSNASVTGTLTVAGASSFAGITFTNGTGTNATTTNFFATNLFATNLLATTGTLTTFNFTNATGSTINALTLSANTVTSTAIFVNGQAVCLSNGTNCQSTTESDTLLTVTNRGSSATSTLTLFGGFIAASSTVTSTFSALGNITLGNDTGDAITVGGRFSSDLVPTTDLVNSLGIASNRWNGYFGNVTATNVTTTNLFASGLLGFGSASGSALTLLSPLNPTSASIINTTGTAFDVVVSNGYAYIADGAEGLQIFDVANPLIPRFVTGTSLGNADDAWEVFVAGKYAYVAYSDSGLRIYDISDPSSPTHVGFVSGATCRALGVYVSGKYAYVGCDANGFQVIDVSNPASPRVVATVSTTAGLGVFVQGRYAYLADGPDGLRIIDISNPEAPVLQDTLDLPDNAGYVSVSGRYAYVTADGILAIIDVASSTNAIQVATTTLPTTGWGVDVSGNFAYVGNFASGLSIINIANPLSPTIVSSFDGGANLARGVFVAGKFAYVAESTGGLRIVDLQGADISTARIGDLQAGSASVIVDLEVGNSIFARNSLNIGRGGLFSDGGIVAATNTTSSFANLLVGTSTYYGGLNSLFRINGDDLFVAGNIGSASSIYTNGELVVGPSSTHYADGRITKLDGSQELTPPVTYGFLMQMTGTFLVQATPDVLNAVPGDIALYAGAGTSTLESGSGVTLQGGAGYNDGSGGAISITGGGSGTSTFTAGGTVYIAGGFASSNGGGGGVNLTGSDTFGTGSGGSLSMIAGTAYGTGSAGALSLTAGSSFGVNNGGDITLSPGISLGGRTGNLVLQSGFGFAPPEFRLNEDQSFGSNYVGFRAPTSVTSDRVWILPASDGTSGQVLSTNGAGNLSFITAGGGGGDASWSYSAASNTYITVTSTANVVIGGTSTTNNDLPLFEMDGDDLLVTGSIGTDGIFASGRVDAPYLNRWFTNPLLTQTVYKGGSATTALSGTDPRGVLFDGSHIWVTDYTALTGNVNKIDPLTNRIVATTTVDTGADGMAFDGTYVWVANGNGASNNVTKINPITNQVVAVVPLGGDFLYAQSVAFDGTYIWVTETGTYPSSSVVRKVDPVTNSVVASVPVGVNPYGIAFDGKYLWVANSSSGTLSKIDPVANTVVATTTVGGQPIGVVFDGNSIWVTTNFITQSAVKVNPITNAVIATVLVGGNPQWMSFDGDYIWVSQAASSSVSKIDPTINAVVDTIALDSPLFGGPVGIAFDGSHMWLATPQVIGPSTISKVPIGVADSSETTSLSLARLLVNSTTSTAPTGTTNYAVTIAYASATTFGGLCVDDITTGPTCPTNPGASIVADGAIIANRFDIAEMYSITGAAEPGDVLVLDASSTATVMKSSGVAYDHKIIGIVSTDPGFVLGWGGGAKVALTGRVPTKISMNNGSIAVGDALVSSDVPGYAMKATQPGMILGYALESVSATGTAQVFVSVGFWAGLAFSPTGQIQIDDSGNVSIMNDLHIGGKLFPSLKGGGIQNDWYLFVNADDPTSTYISTNAAGFMSMDTYDFAERYYSPDELEPGDLVVVSDTGRTHVQRSLNAEQMLLGIVSTRPAFIAGRPATSTYPIALSGRVPTKVSNMNGAIKAGDPLAPTTIPGVAAKAIHTGPIIGLALESFEGANIAKIEVFVNPGWWTHEEAVVESVDKEVTAVAPTSGTIRRGVGMISAGSKRVHIAFDSISAYPFVQVTPRGLIQGNWGTDGYSDTGFDILLSQEQTFDSYFSWQVEPLQDTDRLNLSDGTTADMDPVTGLPYGFTTPTTTEPIVVEPESSPSTSVSIPTESVEPTSTTEIIPEEETAGSTTP